MSFPLTQLILIDAAHTLISKSAILRVIAARSFRIREVVVEPASGYKRGMSEHLIDLDKVRHVAKLARLAIPEATLPRFTEQLETILEYVEQLKQVDVTGVEPMAHAVRLTNVLRDDVVEPALSTEQVLANAPDTDGPFFKVPKVIGDDDSAG